MTKLTWGLSFIFLLLISTSSFAWILIPLERRKISYSRNNNNIQYNNNNNNRLLNRMTKLSDQSAKAGTFFNPVPENNGDNNKKDEEKDNNVANDDNDNANKEIMNIPQQINEIIKLNLKQQKENISNGFATPPPIIKKLHKPKNQKPFVGIGPSLNDVTKPEYDENGYTLYADETTGIKSRVFDALIDYPCIFKLKIIGGDNTLYGDSSIFVNDIIKIVAESCELIYNGPNTIDHTIRYNGKWTSITVNAPVKSSEMLYELYEKVDQDPRVKFKF